MGATGGVEPSEEDRQNQQGGEEKKVPSRFSKLFSSLDHEAIEKGLYKESLQDIFQPCSAPDINEQIIREGICESPELSPTCIVLLAEGIPSWLPVIDGWGAEKIVLYCAKEEVWYRHNQKFKTPLILCPTVAGMAKAGWVEEENKVLLVQGSASFCKKMIDGLTSLGINDQTKIIVTSNEKCRNLKLSFKFLRFSHSRLGGATEIVTSVGFSKACEIDKDVSFTKGIPSTVMDHVCPMEIGEKYEPIKTHTTISEGDTKLLEGNARYPIKAIVTGTFVTPSIFSHSRWVTRKLSNAEILSILDSPVQLSKRVNEEKLDIHLSEIPDKLDLVAPLKILQEATRIFFNWRAPVERPHAVPIYDVNRLGLKLVGLEHIYQEIDQALVAKNDNATSNTSLWDEAALTPPSNWNEEIDFILKGREDIHTVKVLDTLRTVQAKRYKKNIRNSFVNFMKTKYSSCVFNDDYVNNTFEFKRDRSEGKQAVGKAADTSFWEWENGSFPYFWRWQPEIMKDLRDGTSLWCYEDKLPKNTKRQRMPRDLGIFELMVEKIVKVQRRNYIGKWGNIVNLSHYFPVPKGENDIRMVYDLTASGLNAALWAPRFWMPTMTNVVDCAVHTSWFGDVDAGEMFLNFPLDLRMRKYCGVDISWMRKDGSQLWECWHRMAMGMKPSPWVTIRLLSWMMEIVVGDRKETANPFRWDTVQINLPGAEDYNPSLPRVCKWNETDSVIAADCKFFCDDFRVIGPTKDTTKAATHRLESTMSYLGIQDATRKRRAITQTPGEWTGSIVLSVKDVGVFVTVSKKKWNRARDIIIKWSTTINESEELPMLKYSELESDIGFLIHLSMSYPMIKPFLRGFYLTLNSWRDGRDRDGWKIPEKSYKLFLELGRRGDEFDDYNDMYKVSTSKSESQAPEKVQAQELMKEHLHILVEMFSAEEPVLRLVRGSSILEVLYIFGDASGLGFGSSWLSNKKEVKYRFGVWGMNSDKTTSNYRELRNLVETLERSGADGELKGKEVFVFTDNSTAESIAAKGSSSSPLLFELVTRLYKLGMKYLCLINIIHVSGTRMIAQGTDGLSRGGLLEGVLNGEKMLSFIPLHVSALEREPVLRKWILTWAGAGRDGNTLKFLGPEDWFVRGHDIAGYSRNCDGMNIPTYKKGIFIWTPPPAAARIALEELRQARHKRQSSLHIFIVPQLMSPEWRSQLFKAADLILTLPFSTDYWPECHHEKLTVAILFPYLRREPWELKASPLMGRMARELHKVLSEGGSAGRDLLSQLLILTTRLDKVSNRQLCKLLSGRWRSKISHQ